MARDYAAIYTNVWSDPDWKALTPRLQHGYWLLLTQPRLSPCGVLDFIPSRFANLAAGLGRRHVEEIVAELAAVQPHPYVVHDDDTAELLVRSFVRHDSLMKFGRPAKAVAKDFRSIASQTVRQAVLDELRRLRRSSPDLAGWKGFREEDESLMTLIDADQAPNLRLVEDAS